MLRPISRRWEPDEVEEAKKLVARAESQALERAEQLRLEAETLLRAAEAHRDQTATRAREEVAAQLTALRLELDQVTRRASDAEAELERLRAENAELKSRPGAARPDGPEAADPAMATPPLRLVPSPGGPEEEAADTARAREDAMRILAVAAKEAEELLTTAVDTIERETAAAADLRRRAETEGLAAEELRRRAEADLEAAAAARDEAAAEREVAADALSQARAEAERLLEEARLECDALVAAARAEVRSEMAALRRQFATEVSNLRQAMDRARDSVEQILATEHQVG